MDKYKQVLGSSGRAATLPVPLWTGILQHVPQQQRLTQAALVCRTWAPAAAQATVHVERKLKHYPAVAAMESWLAVHAGQLLSLDLSTSRHILDPAQQLQLPLNKLSKLQQLQLEGFNLQLPGKGDSSQSSSSPDTGAKGSSSDGSMPATQLTQLSSLQQLQLKSVDLADISSLMQLTQAPELTILVLESVALTNLQFNVGYKEAPAESVQQVADAMPALLQQLPLLSVLRMPGFPITEAAMQRVAAMTRLQQLTFRPDSNLPVSSFQQLPSSITQLCMPKCYTVKPHITRPFPAQLPQLSGLRHLYLEDCAVPVLVLGSFTQLQLLHLLGGSLLPHEPEAQLDTEATEALLGVLPKLTNLQDLKIHVEGFDTVNIAPQQFSALTASSHLQRLAIGQEVELPIPRGAVQHMFPPGRQMQFMQHLSIEDLYGDPRLDDWCLDSADISSVVSACPQLQELNISTCFQPGGDVSVLLQLPSTCTCLKVGGHAFTDEAVPVLRQLTQVKHLGWSSSKDFTDEGLERLIGFEGEQLDVFDCGLSQQVCDDELSLKSDSELGSVSQQLNELCDLSPILAPERLRRSNFLLEVAEANAAEFFERAQHAEAVAAEVLQRLQHAEAMINELQLQQKQQQTEVEQQQQQQAEAEAIVGQQQQQHTEAEQQQQTEAESGQ